MYAAALEPCGREILLLTYHGPKSSAQDADDSGQLELEEFVYLHKMIVRDELNHVKSMAGAEKTASTLRRVLAFTALVVLVLLGGVAGLLVAVVSAYKDTEASGTVLTTLEGDVVQTSPAVYPLPLIVAPVLPLETLHRLPSLTFSYLDPETLSDESLALIQTCARSPDGAECDEPLPKVSLSSSIAGVIKVNDTAVIFGLASKLATELRVWNGAAIVTLADGLSYDVCESDLTCSALSFHEEANSTALVEAADAALLAGGFGDGDRRQLSFGHPLPAAGGCTPRSTTPRKIRDLHRGQDIESERQADELSSSLGSEEPAKGADGEEQGEAPDTGTNVQEKGCPPGAIC